MNLLSGINIYCKLTVNNESLVGLKFDELKKFANFNSLITYFFIAHYWLFSKYSKLFSADLLRN